MNTLSVQRCRKDRAPRHGLTLLELVVVLTILVAVTTLVVPLLPSFIHRANIASCTADKPTGEAEKYVIFGLNKPRTLFRNMADGTIAVSGFLADGLEQQVVLHLVRIARLADGLERPPQPTRAIWIVLDRAPDANRAASALNLPLLTAVKGCASCRNSLGDRVCSSGQFSAADAR